MFALGRAQELMLILEEYWTQHPELAEVPLWFCSSMADKYLDVYQRSIEYMNDRVKGATANPFEFPHFSKKPFDINTATPCVVIAGPPGCSRTGCRGKSLTSGARTSEQQHDPHRRVLHRGDARVRHPEELQGRHRDGQPPAQAQGHRRHDLVLGPHTDFTQTKGFIEGVNPLRHIYLVHGEKTNVPKPHDELLKLYKPRNITVHFSS